MYLKTLKLLGFKSFADRTRLELEPGVTVIVGPNGSGKSNTVDALAWVMGTQATKQLRTTKMEEVIFSGTSNRPPHNRAEVSVTFDNADGRIPLDLSEVTITRRLLRDGTSEYEINGASCRLLDIQELLSDGNVGRNQHIIVNQGQVTEVLNASPEQHRAVIEEAAGVLKHRTRRQRAERRLERTAVDLARLNDIQRELQRQMRPLARQAKAAERYVELKARTRALRLYVGGRSLDALRARAAEVAAERKVHAATLAAHADEIAGLDAGIERLGEETGDVARALQRDTAAAARLETTRERLDRIASVAGERSRSLFAGFEQRDDRLRDLAEEAERLEKELLAIADERAAARSNVDRTEIGLKALEDEERSLAEQEVMPAEGIIASLRGDLAALEAAERRDALESDATRRRIQEVSAVVDSGQTTLESAQHELRSLDKALFGVRQTLEDLSRRTGETATRLADAEADEAALRLRRAGLVSKIATLKTAVADPAARSRVEAHPGVVGSLLELLQVPPDLVPATTAALGPWLESVVVAASGDLDRVLDGFEIGSLRGLALVAPAGRDGSRGAPPGLTPLVELLEAHVAPAGKEIMETLLSGVAVTEDWQSALEMARRHPDWQVVTRAGDLVRPTGLALGLAVDRGPLAAGQAETDLARLEDELAQASAAVEVARQAHAVAQQDVRAAQDERERLQTQRSELALALEQAQQSTASGQAELVRLESRLASLSEASGHRGSRLADLRSRLQALQGEEAKRQAVWEDLMERRSSVVAQRDMAREARQSAAATLASLDERRRMLLTRSGEVAAEIGRLQAIDITSSEPERLVGIEDVAREAIAIIGRHLGELRERQRVNRDAAGDSDLQLESARARRAELDAAMVEAKEQDGMLAVEAEGLRVRLDAVAEALRRDVDASEDEAIAAPQPEVGDDIDPVSYDWQAELEEKEAALRRIGPVNPLAAQEYETLAERSAFQADQIADLETSATELRKVIRALDDTMAQLFHDAFNDIAEFYAENFEMLFPGGRGRLRLEDPDNVLETGVVIDAQPAGKKLRRLSLLSGGERSLAALAFLFAVFRARPSPFYMLDEVEAALDDANLRRFLRLVDALRATSQVIIITHQQQTMQVADILYGVTMEPGGSSKVIAKRLRDVTAADLTPRPADEGERVVPSSP